MPFNLPSAASIAYAGLAAAAGLAPVLAARRADAAAAAALRHASFTATYEGAMGGEPATATAAYDVLADYGLLSGEIRCGGRIRVFTAEIFGNGGFGHLVDRQTGEHMRVHVAELSQASFILTLHPFSGTPQSTHCFERRKEA